MIEKKKNKAFHGNGDVKNDPEIRFWFYARALSSGCIEWMAYRNIKGYGVFKFEDKARMAHRWAYARYVGPIPKDYQIDHLCRNRACVNPEHLEAVTFEENFRRGIPYMPHRDKTHCPSGHEYTFENTQLKKRTNGGYSRSCRMCGRIYQRRKMNELKTSKKDI